MLRVIRAFAILIALASGLPAAAHHTPEVHQLGFVGEKGTLFLDWVRRPAKPGESILGWCGDDWECGKAFFAVNRKNFPRTVDSDDDFFLLRGKPYLFPVLEERAVEVVVAPSVDEVADYNASLLAGLEERFREQEATNAALLSRVEALEAHDRGQDDRLDAHRGRLDAQKADLDELRRDFDEEWESMQRTLDAAGLLPNS